MITNFKLFENKNENISQGDYVLLDIYSLAKEYNYFINNNIGEVIYVQSKYDDDENEYVADKIEVRFVVSKENFYKYKAYFRYVYFEQSEDYWCFSNIFSIFYVKYYCKSKEELELKMNTNKYNL